MTWVPLADLARDVAGELPDGLMDAWRDPDQRTDELAASLLQPLRREGLLVCSDTAGLSRMASVEPLAVVLKRIAEPKARIHTAGTGLGGRAIGTWVADNTEMLYPSDTSADDLLTAMIRIHDTGAVQVGFCLHAGVFYEVGDALHGPDADRCEDLAEDHTSGLETLITPAFRSLLTEPHTFMFTERTVPGHGTVFAVQTERNAPTAPGTPDFPIPYDAPMHALLNALDETRPAPAIDAIEQRYQHLRTVLLAQRHSPRPTTPAETVQTLFDDTRFQSMVKRLLVEHTPHWNVGGALALAAFADPAQAVQCARDLQAAGQTMGCILNIGLETGHTYLFPMPKGRTEFAGDPVNRASKMAEDLCDPGDLCVSAAVAEAARIGDAVPVEWTISGITIAAFRLV